MLRPQGSSDSEEASAPGSWALTRKLQVLWWSREPPPPVALLPGPGVPPARPKQRVVTGSGGWVLEGRRVRGSEGRVPHPRAGRCLLHTHHRPLECFLPWPEAPTAASSPQPHLLPDRFPRPGANSLPAQGPSHNPSCLQPSHQTHLGGSTPAPRGYTHILPPPLRGQTHGASPVAYTRRQTPPRRCIQPWSQQEGHTLLSSVPTAHH